MELQCSCCTSRLSLARSPAVTEASLSRCSLNPRHCSPGAGRHDPFQSLEQAGSRRSLLQYPLFPYWGCQTYACACSPYNIQLTSVTQARLGGGLLWLRCRGVVPAVTVCGPCVTHLARTMRVGHPKRRRGHGTTHAGISSAHALCLVCYALVLALPCPSPQPAIRIRGLCQHVHATTIIVNHNALACCAGSWAAHAHGPADVLQRVVQGLRRQPAVLHGAQGQGAQDRHPHQ